MRRENPVNNNQVWKRNLLFAFRIILGGIFIFAALPKIADPSAFARDITNYQMMPRPFVNLFALTLPMIELICGILIIIGFRVRANSAIINLMLIVFIVAITYAVLRDLNISCGCFGTTNSQKVGMKKILEDAAMLGMGLSLMFAAPSMPSLDAYLVSRRKSSIAPPKSKKKQ